MCFYVVVIMLLLLFSLCVILNMLLLFISGIRKEKNERNYKLNSVGDFRKLLFIVSSEK
jgi:hypothetical protein